MGSRINKHLGELFLGLRLLQLLVRADLLEQDKTLGSGHLLLDGHLKNLLGLLDLDECPVYLLVLVPSPFVVVVE